MKAHASERRFPTDYSQMIDRADHTVTTQSRSDPNIADDTAVTHANRTLYKTRSRYGQCAEVDLLSEACSFISWS